MTSRAAPRLRRPSGAPWLVLLATVAILLCGAVDGAEVAGERNLLHGEEHEHDAEDHAARVRCRACGAALSEINDVVDLARGNMSPEIVDGELPVHRFVNPDGEDFEVATVRDASVTATGPWNAAATFFANYEWKVIRCSRCGMQVGWWYRIDPQGACAAAHPPHLEFHHHHHHDEHARGHAAQHGQASELASAGQPTGAERANRSRPDAGIEEASNMKWVLESLKDICLEKDLGDHVVEWCYEKAAQVRKKATDAVVQVLGTQQSIFQGPLSEAPAHELGGKPRPYFPIQLTRGSSCNFDEDHLNSAQVHLMCCDSFPATRQTVDNLQQKHMRIELARSRRPCTFELYVCVPRICLVPPFAILHQQVATKASGNMALTGAAKLAQTRELGDQAKISSAMANACPLRNFYGLIRENIIVDGAPDALWIESMGLSL